MSNTNKSTSESQVNLGAQSTLEELLGGVEQMSEEDQRLLESKKKRVSQLGGNPNTLSERNRLMDEIAAIESGPKKRIGGFLETGMKNLIGQNTSLQKLIDEYGKTGGLPSDTDVGNANNLAKSLFSARRTALEQSLEDQYTEANRVAAQRGFMSNDPVATAKMRTGFMRQRDMLGAEEQAQATNIAMGIPQQRLGLYQQGLSNLSTLLGQGSALLSNEQNFRLATAPKTATNTQTESGFNTFTSAISAPIAGVGAIMSGAGALQQGASFAKMASPSGGGSFMSQLGYPSAMPQPSFGMGNLNTAYPTMGNTYFLGK